MFSKLQEFIILALMILSFGLGYGFRNSLSSTAVSQTSQTKDNHTVVTTVTTKAPNGDVKIVKTIDSDIKTNILKEVKVTVPAPPASKFNVSALAGVDVSHLRSLQPIYGVSVSKQVFGPVTAGAFGLTNGIIGVSLGVSFWWSLKQKNGL